MKVRRDNRSGQSTKLNVIFELICVGIQRGGHSPRAGAVLGWDFTGGFEVGLEVDRGGLRRNRDERKR
jgi:hypothetical protein